MDKKSVKKKIKANIDEEKNRQINDSLIGDNEEDQALIMDVFLQLDDFNDGNLQFQEIEPLLSYFKELGEEDNTDEHFRTAFDQYQNESQLDYEGFNNFVREIGLLPVIPKISDEFYTQNFGSRLTKICFGCCKGKMKSFRLNKMKQRVKIEKTLYEDNQAEEKAGLKAKAAETWAIISQILNAYTVAADHFSDWYLVYSIYWIGVREQNKLNLNYKLVTITTLMSIASTFLITYSSYIQYLKDSGKFEPAQMVKLSCFGKFKNYISLTFFGPLLFLLISPLEMFKGLIQLPVYMVKGINGFKAIDFWFSHLIEKLTGLHHVQLKYMADQRKISQLFFESLPMLLLQILMVADIVSCPEIVKDGIVAIIISSLTATLSIITNFTQLRIQSKAFKEPFSLYALTTLNAKQNWIPFLWQVEQRNIQHSINYGMLEINIPGITSKLGIFQALNFQFSDQTLLYFSNKLSFYQSYKQAEDTNEDNKLIKQKFKIGKSLDLVSINTLLHFVHNFPFQYLNLDLKGVDWQKCLNHSIKREFVAEMIRETDQKKMIIGSTQSSIPLLFVCVDNEPEDLQQQWLLQDCMQILLENDFDPNIRNRFDDLLLTHAISQKKTRSIEMLLKYSDLYQGDKMGRTALGQAIMSNDIKTFDRIVQQMKGYKFLQGKIILDPSLSYNSINLIEYFCKRCISCVQNKEEDINSKPFLIKIHELFMKREYKMETEEEKQKFFRSCVKVFSQRYENLINWQKVTLLFSEIAKMSDIDIFNYVDRKQRNFAYVFCKHFCGRIDSSADHSNSYDQLKVFHSLLSDKPVENMLVDVKKMIWEKTIANKQIPYGFQLIEKQVKNSSGEMEVSLFINKFMNKSKFENVEIENLCLEFLYKSAQKTWQGTNEWVWPVIQKDIYSALKFKTKDQVIKEHIEKSKDLSFDSRKTLYRNYGIEFDQTSDSKKQDKENQENNEQLDGKSFKVTVCKKGKHPEYARYIDDEEQLNKSMNLLKQSIKHQITTSLNTNESQQSIIEQFFNLLIELVSTFDLVTDIYVLRQFVNSPHNMWLAINIFSIVSPLFVCISPYITFKMEKLFTDYYLNQHYPLYRQIMSFITFTPLIIIFFFTMDIFFLIFSGILGLLIQIIRIFSCGKLYSPKLTEGNIDKSFNVVFEMSKLDVAGFRRLRTISQLSFESFIQIILQLRILLYSFTNAEEVENLGISYEAIFVSLSFALLHMIIEFVFLGMEAKATKTTLTHYAIICFNGRFGWVPFSHIFSDPNQQNDVELNYENIQSSFLCTDFVMDFQFTDDTMAGLTRAICNLPIEIDSTKRIKLNIGASADQVGIMAILNLLQVSHQRVNIEMAEVNVDEKIKRSGKIFQNQLFVEKEPKEVPLIYKLAQLNCFQMVQKLIRFGASIDFKLPSGLTIVDLAIQNNYAELMSVLIEEKTDFVNKQLSWVDPDQGQTKMNQSLQKLNFDMVKTFCTSPKINMCHYAQYGLMERALNKINEGQIQVGTRILNCLYGPDERLKVFAKKSDTVQVDLIKYFEQFPEEICFYSKGKIFQMLTEYAFKFSLLRKVILNEWSNQKGDILNDLTKSRGTKADPIKLDHLDVDLDQLILVSELLQGGHSVGNLTLKEVQELDSFSLKLGLDKDQWIYSQQSRLNDQTGQSLQIFIKGKSCQALAGDNKNSTLQYDFHGRGGIKHDDWRYGSSLKLKFPVSALTLSRLQTDYQLTDQGWGGTGSVQLSVDTYFQNYAQSGFIKSVNRNDSQHPNYTDIYDSDIINQRFIDKNMSMVDTFCWLKDISVVEFRPKTPPWGGWKMSSKMFTVNMKVNLSFDCNPEQEKHKYEQLLEEFYKAESESSKK